MLRSTCATPLVLLLLAGLAACGGDTGQSEPLRLPPVTVEPVHTRTVQDRIEATGEIQAPEYAEIAAEVSGRITEIRVAEGTAVETGTVLAEIDRQRRELEVASARAQLAQAQAALAEQERDSRRIRTLHERNVASESRLDEAETALTLARSRVDAARASLGVAERALRDSSLAAPFAGIVARRLVSRGEFVNAGQSLFELVALDPIEVELHLPEVDSGRVRVGQPVEVTVVPYPEAVFRATLTFVSPTIDPGTRTLRVKAQLANPDGRLRPGLFARADLGVAERAGVILIPEEAVLQRADGAVAFRLLEEDHVERVRIETGGHREGLVEVVSGLEPSDVVVVRGHADLADGVRVAVQRANRHSSLTASSREPGARARP